MKQHEISLDDIPISDDTKQQLELHSFLNIINLISLKLSLLGMKLDAEDQLAPAVAKTLQLAKDAHQGNHAQLYPHHIEQFQEFVASQVEPLRPHRDPDQLKLIDDTLNLLAGFFVVLKARSAELLSKLLHPGKWEALRIADYKDEFHNFFLAVEKNSQGLYRIIYNIAQQEDKDYLVRLDVDSVFGDVLYMPLSFKDVIRDLVANARKYTPPGGQLDIGIYQDKTNLRFSVQDNGIGIPEGELRNVFEFGYRASNAADKPTMGGGFGLTKAAYVTKQLGGRLFLASKEGEGTRLHIEIPIPKNVIQHAETHV